MKTHIIQSYENYREEDRLATNKARRIEFLTTVRILDELLDGPKTILDCAAGTGIYSFYYADKGHTVTATDITPRHIEVIRDRLSTKSYKMKGILIPDWQSSSFIQAFCTTMMKNVFGQTPIIQPVRKWNSFIEAMELQ